MTALRRFRGCGDEVVHGDSERVGKFALGANGTAAAAGLDVDDLYPIDAGDAGEGGLRLIAKLAPDPQGRLSVDESVYHVGRNQLFFAASDPCLDGKRCLDGSMVILRGVQAASGVERLRVSVIGSARRIGSAGIVQAAICS